MGIKVLLRYPPSSVWRHDSSSGSSLYSFDDVSLFHSSFSLSSKQSVVRLLAGDDSGNLCEKTTMPKENTAKTTFLLIESLLELRNHIGIDQILDLIVSARPPTIEDLDKTTTDELPFVWPIKELGSHGIFSRSYCRMRWKSGHVKLQRVEISVCTLFERGGR